MQMSEPVTAAMIMRRCLESWNLRQNLMVPRCCLSGHEADLLIIRPSGWVEEVEIKISVSDFRAEWKHKAEKHEDLLLGRCRYILHSEAAKYAGDPRLLKRGHWWYLRDRPGLIRRFHFAFPRHLAEKLLPEVPEHYGVISAYPGWRVLRKATNLKVARKISDAERFRALESTYQRFWDLTLNRPTAFLEALLPPHELDD